MIFQQERSLLSILVKKNCYRETYRPNYPWKELTVTFQPQHPYFPRDITSFLEIFPRVGSNLPGRQITGKKKVGRKLRIQENVSLPREGTRASFRPATLEILVNLHFPTCAQDMSQKKKERKKKKVSKKKKERQTFRSVGAKNFFSNGFEERLVGNRWFLWPPFDGGGSNEHREWRAFNFRGEIYGTVGENWTRTPTNL